MMKNYSLWLKITSAFQLLTGLVHSLSFFISPTPANETERQIQELLHNYQKDMGAGIHRSFEQIITDLSAHFALLFLFAGFLNWYLVAKKVDITLLRGVNLINLLVFGVSFGLNVIFAFLPPITLTGIVFLLLIASRVSLASAVNA